jgi:DNA-binding XRE family transcriptional regulator
LAPGPDVISEHAFDLLVSRENAVIAPRYGAGVVVVPGTVPPRTKLAAARQEAGIPQSELARLTGLSLKTIQRMESGENDNPKLRYLVLCSFVLARDWWALIEDEWLKWGPVTPQTPPRPPTDSERAASRAHKPGRPIK